MIKLTEQAQMLLKEPETQMKIAIDCKRTLLTVSNWIKHGHENVTKKHVIKSIINHTNLKEDELFE